MGIIQTTKQLRPRHPRDYYPTPIELCRAALRAWAAGSHSYANRESVHILDPGAGDGVWGRAAREMWPNATIIGIELEKSQATHKDCYDSWLVGDYLTLSRKTGLRFDFIVGNPPYAMAMPFIEQSFDLLKSWGNIYFLLRLAFLESQRRYAFWTQEHSPRVVRVLSRRPSYTGNMKTDATAYAMIEWTYHHYPNPSLEWLMWDYDK